MAVAIAFAQVTGGSQAAHGRVAVPVPRVRQGSLPRVWPRPLVYGP